MAARIPCSSSSSGSGQWDRGAPSCGACGHSLFPVPCSLARDSNPVLFTDSRLKKQTAGSNLPSPFSPSLLRHDEEHPSRTTAPKPSTAKQNRDLGYAQRLFSRAALRCCARGFPTAPLFNRTALPSCSSWGATAQIRDEAGAGGGSGFAFLPSVYRANRTM